MGYSRKNTDRGRRGGGVEDMECPRVLKNKQEHVEISGVN